MKRGAEPRCPKADAVLAVFLDGDFGARDPEAEDGSGFQFACSDLLASHLRDCGDCRRTLQRARRLDAALAEAAGRTIASHALAGDRELDALLARALARAAASKPAAPAQIDAPAPAAAARRRAPRPAPPMLGALVGLGLLLLLLAMLSLPRSTAAGGASADQAAVLAGPPHGAARRAANLVAPTAAPNTGSLQAGSLQAGSLQAGTANAGLAHAGPLQVAADAARRPLRPRPVPTAATEDLLQQVADGSQGLAGRLSAVRELLAVDNALGGPTAAETTALTEALARVGDESAGSRQVHRDLLALARRSPGYLANLQAGLERLDGSGTGSHLRRLRDLALLTVAVRLQVRSLDLALLRAVRRQPQLAETVAAALRCGLRPDSGASLLLDCWHELAVRGLLDDDERAARLWFPRQPAAMFDALLDELRTARAAPRRARCLLALAYCPDARVVPALLERLDSGNRTESVLAAFALSQLPRHCLAPLAGRAAQDREAACLRAALAVAGVPESAAWLDVLGVSMDDRRLLSSSSLARFHTVVGWFRDRPPPAGD